MAERPSPAVEVDDELDVELDVEVQDEVDDDPRIDGTGVRVDRPRILVVQPHSLMAEGLQLALSARDFDVEVCGGPTAQDVIEVANSYQPSCVLLNIRFTNGVGSGLALIEPLVAAGAHVVMLTSERRRSVLAECLELGAAGWIAKSAALDEVEAALGRLLEGGSIIGKTIRAHMINTLRAERERERCLLATFEQLTQREALVLAALVDGLTADEIAREHYVALATVRSQIRAVLQKLDVHSQLAAVSMAAPHRDLLPSRLDAQRDRRRSSRTTDGTGADVALDIA